MGRQLLQALVLLLRKHCGPGKSIAVSLKEIFELAADPVLRAFLAEPFTCAP